MVSPRVVALDLRYSKATDFQELARVGRLRELDLWNARIRSLEGFEALASLRWLQLYRTPIQDLSPLAGLDQLVSLSLCRCSLVKDLAALRGLVALRRLNVSHTGVTDLSPLAALTKLEYLWARDLKPINTSALHALKNLKRLDIVGSKLSAAAKKDLKAALPDTRVRV